MRHEKNVYKWPGYSVHHGTNEAINLLDLQIILIFIDTEFVTSYQIEWTVNLFVHVFITFCFLFQMSTFLVNIVQKLGSQIRTFSIFIKHIRSQDYMNKYDI